MPNPKATPKLPMTLDTREITRPKSVDQSLDGSTEADFSEIDHLRSIFNKNITSKPVKHDSVAVLLLSWLPKFDDLNVRPEVDRLKAVFADQYGFHVIDECLDLDLHSPQAQINAIISGFVFKYGLEQSLLIVYYAGHGYYEDGNLKMTGTATNVSNAEYDRRSIAWDGTEHNLKSVEADVLVIFDCCEAGSLGQGRGTRTHPFEFLAACGPGEVAEVPGQASFTTALVKALEKLRSENRAFHSAELLQYIKDDPALSKNQHPSLMSRKKPRNYRLWMAPIKADNKIPDGHYQEPDHEYLDLRFRFYKKLDEQDIIQTARGLSQLLVNGHYDEFPVRDIVLVRKSSYQAYIEHLVVQVQRRYRARTCSEPLRLAQNAKSTFRHEKDGLLSPGPSPTAYAQSNASDDEFAPGSDNVAVVPNRETPLSNKEPPPEIARRVTEPTNLTQQHSRMDPETREGVRHHLKGLLRAAAWYLVAFRKKEPPKITFTLSETNDHDRDQVRISEYSQSTDHVGDKTKLE